jgi:surfeit locus 1 family protein
VSDAATARSRLRAGLLVPGLAALAALILFTLLGTWQVERKAWKESLIDTLDRRLVADPVSIPPSEDWPSLTAEKDEFRRVSSFVTFEPDSEALVYTVGSTLRGDVSGPGYWVFAPAKFPGGATVVLDRGFVPEGQQDPAAHRPFAGPVATVGVMRWPEERAWFTPNDDPSRSLWFVRDHRAMAAVKGWGEVAPFYVELETPSGHGDLPRSGRLTVNLRNDHLQYALTWYGLAVVVVIGFGFWLRSHREQIQPVISARRFR